MNYLNNIKNTYQNVNDLIIKNINKTTIVYIESLVDQDKINNFILKQLVNNKRKELPTPNAILIESFDDLKNYLNNGFTILISKKCYAIETRANITRNVSNPTQEASILGPKESLTENIQTNIGLIRRRIKTNNLKNINMLIGKYSNTSINILYINSIIKKDLPNKIKDKLKKINIDGINDISELKQYLNDKNIFPAFKLTERPDVISNSLLNGKVIILMDNSPYALIIPSFLADFINPISDNYVKNININFFKILRIFCFILSIITPAFYIAITTYNQETIPTSLLINFQNQRIGVPFPALIECLITLIVCEILRESDLRFPSNYGSAISILGALVLGDAAVSAGIVSPIMIIAVSITYISSLIFTDIEINNALRYWRFVFLFISSIYGLYGIFISTIFFLINITSYEIFDYPYLYPLSPFDLTYIKETLFKLKNNKRSKLLSNNTKKGDL